MTQRELHALGTLTRLWPRYSETDQMGIVYHANYLIWFHEARDAMVSNLGLDICEIEKCGFRFPIIETACRHRSPARYGEEVAISAAPVVEEGQPISLARLRVHYRVSAVKSGQALAEGETVNVITDNNGRLLLRFPPCFEPLARRIEDAINNGL